MSDNVRLGDGRVPDTELDAVLRIVGDILFPIHEDGISLPESGALEYIRRILSGRCADDRNLYEHGVRWLHQQAQAMGAASFGDLCQSSQEQVVDDLMTRARSIKVPLGLSGSPTASALASIPGEVGFILMFWQHLREGLFCDPRHGGNTDARVWQWLGYNGPQMHGYTDSEVLSNAPLKRPIRTADMWMRDRNG